MSPGKTRSRELDGQTNSHRSPTRTREQQTTYAKPQGRGTPTSEHLKELHQAYQKYMETEPWRELTERNPYAIEHPLTSESAWCMSMGHWKTEHGVAMFVDPNGIEGYFDMAIIPNINNPPDCRKVSATTGGRNLVDRAERRRLRDMDISYAENQWPIWFRMAKDPFTNSLTRRNINDHEAMLLAHALKSATDIALQARAGTLSITTDEREQPAGDPIPALTCRLNAEGQWQHSPLTLTPPKPRPVTRH